MFRAAEVFSTLYSDFFSPMAMALKAATCCQHGRDEKEGVAGFCCISLGELCKFKREIRSHSVQMLKGKSIFTFTVMSKSSTRDHFFCIAQAC